MNGDYEPVDTRMAPPRRRPLLAWLLVPGIAFLLGTGAMGYVLARWDSAARVIGVAPEPEPAPPAIVAPPGPVQPTLPAAAPIPGDGTEPERIVIDPEITRRVAELERRVGQVGTEARAAVGNADRAEGLLVAFAARRALDRGVALGFLEALLGQRFGETQPQAVGAIITAAREPVTLQELQDGLQQVAPQLAGAPPDQNWWGALRTELGSLITVRREGTPSTEPTERVRRATRRLEAGQVDVALAEVLRLPARDRARDWILKARRYVIARRALDTIETAALLEPRTQPAAPAQPQPQPQPQPRPRPQPAAPRR